MEFYDKFLDRFQAISEVKITLLSERSSNYLEFLKENVLGENDGVTLTMLYLKVLHDMFSHNS